MVIYLSKILLEMALATQTRSVTPANQEARNMLLTHILIICLSVQFVKRKEYNSYRILNSQFN